MNKIYTGIGSRNTPKDICKYFTKLSMALAKHSYILRSGGAEGADTAFETGCDKVNGKKEIYLPWCLFNNNTSLLYNIDKRCYDIIKKYCPYFDNLRQGQKKCIARDVHQVYGKDLDNIILSDFIVCYAKLNNKGKIDGGTQYAIKLAEDNGVKVFNAYTYDNLTILSNDIKEFIGL